MIPAKRTSGLALLLAIGLAAGALYAQDKPAPDPIVTYDKVLEYLKLEVKEEKILKLLENSPTHFTLSKEQVDELKKAGASEKLLEAMRKKVGAGGKHDEAIADFAIILDVSGSMRELTPEGKPKWDAAQKGAIDLIDSIPNGCRLTFVVYGHDVERKCESVDVVRPLSPLKPGDNVALKDYIHRLKPAGHTPIALALRKAGEELAKSEAFSKVILLTDGMETCHGDPAKEAAQLLARNRNLKGVDVVGLGLNPKEAAEVAKIARAGKGKYYDAQNVAQLQEAFRGVKKESGLPAVAPAEVVQKEPAAPILRDEEINSTAPSSDVKSPAALPLGKVVAGRLGESDKTGKYHYWLVDLPAGSYKAVLDIKRADDKHSNVAGMLEWFSLEGKKLDRLGQMNAIDYRHRSVFGFRSDQPIRRVLRVDNNHSVCDYQLGIFTQEERVSTPFFKKCPKVEPIQIGQAVTTPLLDADRPYQCDAYYSIRLPAGDYRISTEFRRQDRKSSNVGGTLHALGVDGEHRDKVLHVNGIKPALKESAKLSLADEMTFILRVEAGFTRETAVLLVEKWPEN
jgi:hypothetical protein